jgi:predicted small secreted protein|tara:strand:+ start:259 stop:453 length:195 start_codon:yes stop_codon:yes gene_type:complete
VFKTIYIIQKPNYLEEITMKKLVIASLTAMFVLTGCNTFAGFGQDVERAGEAVTDGAQDVKQKI